MKYLKWTLVICLGGLALAACGSKGGGGSGTTGKVTSAVNKNFYESDDQCYKASSNEKVSTTNCANLSYYIDRGQCKTNADADTKITNCTANEFYMGTDACYRNGEVVDVVRCYEDGEVPGGIDGARKRVCTSGEFLQWVEVEEEIFKPYYINCQSHTCYGYLFSLNDQIWVECLKQ